MTPYRDELAAAHARIAKLERELAALRNVDASPLAAPAPLPRRFGNIYFHRPRTLVPLLQLYVLAVRLALRRPPILRASRSTSVVTWALVNGVARPLMFALWTPAYYAGLAIALPLIGLIYVAGSIALVPIVVAASFTFDPEPPVRGGWFAGLPETFEAEGALFPLLLGPWFPLFLPALVGNDVWPRR